MLVWPTSISLMAIGPSTSPGAASVIWVLSTALNGMLHSLVAFALFKLHCLVFRSAP
jgi:hypothetical protein